LFGALSKTVNEELRGCFEAVTWHISPEVEQHTQEIQALVAEVAFYAAREVLRNAARHAHPVDTLILTITATWKDGLEIVIEDNGVSPLEPPPGSSGQGLILHSTMMAVVGGSLALESAPGAHTRVTLRLPEGVEG
jgi:signal transduction histidine kinase